MRSSVATLGTIRSPCGLLTHFPGPWMLQPRQMLLRDHFLEHLGMEEYVAQVYDASCSQVSYLPDDTPENRRHRRLFALTTQYFMQTL